MSNNNLVSWLFDGPPWVRYRTWIDLLGGSDDSPEVITSRERMITHPKVMALVRELGDWPGYPLKRHNDANHPIHKLAFLADIGLTQGDPGIDAVIVRILDGKSTDSPFQVVMNIHPRYGGLGIDQLVWMLCDAPVVIYSLIKFGLGEHPKVLKAGEYLINLIRENGWPCAATSDLSKFNGPGRKSDPCPYANLVMLKIMALVPAWRDMGACQVGVEVLLDLWSQRKEVRPYLFAMGTHFSRLKTPLIWYDILHVLDVMSQFPWIGNDPRLTEMVNVLEDKADEIGRFRAESVWRAWKDWEFGQKAAPSYWITLVSQRIMKRMSAKQFLV